jgi:hypothetical protein
VSLVTAIAFLLTPMHWWARYTLWILGLGLPCLAWALEQRRPFRAQRWAGAWMVLLLFLFLAELLAGFGWVAGADPVDWYGCDPFPPRPKIAMNRLSWYRPFAAIDVDNGSEICREILAGRDPVAIGPLEDNGLLSGSMMGMFGALCDPSGRRPVLLLKPKQLTTRDELGRFLRRYRIRYIVWDIEGLFPQPLREMTTPRRERKGSFRYYEVDPAIRDQRSPAP